MYERMLKENQRINSQIKTLEKQLQGFPNQDFFCSKNGSYYKWYSTENGKSTYIPKSNREYAEKLATKKLLSLRLEELKQEKSAIQFYLRHHSTGTPKSEQLLINCPEYRTLTTNYVKPISKNLATWAKEDYPRNLAYKEYLIHRTPSGNMVRSKSEVMIDSILFKYKIPFRYECLLLLGQKEIFPDFTIRHPKTGEFFYWEHNGKMDDPEYRQKAFSKLQLYTEHGIIPSVQLITTYETLNHPLSMEMIEKIVDYYFL